MLWSLLRRHLLESGAVPTRYLNAVSRALDRRVPFGRNVLDYDWDACVVLDACRWDLFREFAPRHDVYPRFETVSSAWSVASCTPDWIPRTFEGRRRRELAGTVYVVDNGHSDLLGEEPPVELDEVWRYGREADSWLVDPELVTERALAHVGRRDVERVLVHYTVPHAPFRHAYDRYSLGTEGDERESSTVWDGLEAGAFDEREVWEDYGRNLLLGLDQVAELVDRTEGRILVTSDHGNLLGEYGLYGHPRGVAYPELRRVPWAWAVGRGDDDDLPAWEPASEPGTATVEDNLAALGYR